MYKNVSLADYADMQLGQQMSGDYNQQDVEMLYKAMSAGDITGRETTDSLTASGAPLKVESLENTLKILVNTSKHTPFFYKIAKKPATNTVEEYNQLVSYGDLEGGSTLEGELPENADSVYRRKAQLIKYFGVVGGVTHQMQLVSTGSGIANMLATETKNKVELMTKLLEGYLPFADSRIVPTLFNGFIPQHEQETGYANMDAYMDSELVIDMRGRVLDDDAVEKASLGIIQNFGIGTTLISSPRTFSNFVQKYHSKKWIMPVSEQVRDGVFGQRMKTIVTQNGDVEIMQSNFFKYSRMRKLSDLATSAKAPAAPVADAETPIATAVDTYGGFSGAEGDYYYAVSARNRFGESVLVSLNKEETAKVAVGSTQSIDLKFTAGVQGSSEPATGFCIYRSEADPWDTKENTPMYKIFEIPASALTANNGWDGAEKGLVRDRNRFFPNTDQAMLVEWDPDQVLAWKQLAPMMKMNLAVVAPIQRFMVLCYGAAFLYAPRKMVRFINIGSRIS